MVVVAPPLQQRVTEWDDYAGRFEAVEAVEVRPRVSGLLNSIHFSDGEMVRRGQTLFTIDARPFAARLAQARAQVARAEATLANAQSELKRARALLSSRFVSEATAETRLAAEREAAAELAAARAAADAAALELSFTRVVAPVSGRVSYHRLAAGNLVTAETSLLTTIMGVDPIRFVFDAPEAALLKHRRSAPGGSADPVEIRLQDETDYRWKGRIEAIDNAFDVGSGTIRGQATVRNPAGFLVPGMFGQMRWLAPQPVEALLVPDEAVVTDQTQQVVYVVGKDGTVSQKPIEPGRLIGNLRVVRSGISPEDRIVISGVQRARPGRKVETKPGRIAPASASAAPGQPLPT